MSINVSNIIFLFEFCLPFLKERLSCLQKYLTLYMYSVYNIHNTQYYNSIFVMLSKNRINPEN